MDNTLGQAKRQYAKKREHAFSLQDSASEILGAAWPVSACLKRPVNSAGVSIRYNGERARFHGVSTCQSPWTCPICARRIMGGRRAEIENILTKAYKHKGWVGLFLTLTLSHHTASRLEELLSTLAQAWSHVFSGDRTGKRQILARVKTQIKRLEVKIGKNGWHPHLHVLLLVDESGLSELEAGQFEDELSAFIFNRYALKVEKLGMRAEKAGFDAHAIRDTAGALSTYVSKLEMSLELTSSETKTSEESVERGITMFQALSMYARGERQVYGKDIAALFREYALSTKSKRAVSYGREVKNLLGIEEKSDEELAIEEEKPEEKTLAVVSIPLWKVICERKLRAALLDIADSGDETRVSAWLEALAESAGPIGEPEPGAIPEYDDSWIESEV